MKMHNDEMEAPSELSRGLMSKAKLSVHVDMNAGYASDNKWRKDEFKRLKSEISATEKFLKDWDAEKVAAQAKRSLESELAVKRARLLECEAKMDADGVEYDDDSADEKMPMKMKKSAKAEDEDY
jgi:hypothetical protein